jgi:hypothetical protein
MVTTNFSVTRLVKTRESFSSEKINSAMSHRTPWHRIAASGTLNDRRSGSAARLRERYPSSLDHNRCSRQNADLLSGPAGRAVRAVAFLIGEQFAIRAHRGTAKLA